jgi:hypothetical protein
MGMQDLQQENERAYDGAASAGGHFGRRAVRGSVRAGGSRSRGPAAGRAAGGRVGARGGGGGAHAEVGNGRRRRGSVIVLTAFGLVREDPAFPLLAPVGSQRLVFTGIGFAPEPIQHPPASARHARAVRSSCQ